MSSASFEWLHIRLLPVYVAVEIVGLIDRLFNVVWGPRSKITLPVLIFAAYVAVVWACITIVRAREPGSGAYKHAEFWRKVARVLALLATIAVIVSFVPSGIIREVVPSDRLILVADVEDYTGDPNFPAAAMKRAFVVALEQSEKIGTLPPGKTEEILQKMGKAPDEKIDEELGKQICIRADIGPLLVLRVKGFEDKYLLSGRIIIPKTGQALGQLEIQAVNKASLTQALGHLAQNLRREFGDSFYDVKVSSKSLDEATTSSIDALRAYSEAEQFLQKGDYNNARLKLDKALELDSDFAMAWRELASLYEYQAEVPKAVECLTRAYELRDRLTEVERVRVEEYYYGLVRDDPEQALSKIAESAKNFPQNPGLLGTLADTASRLMRFRIAKDAEEKEQILLGKPSFESAFASWATELSLNNFGKAVDIAEHLPRDRNLVPLIASRLALGDSRAAETEIADLPVSAKNEDALWAEGLVDLYKGRLQAAYGHWLQYVEMLDATKSGTDTKLIEKQKGMGRLGLARIALLRGDTHLARENLDQVAGVRDEYMAEAGKYYARIGDLQKADELLANLRARMAKGKRETKYGNRALLELLEGEIELRRGRKDRALDLLSDAAKYPWRYLYLQVHDSLANAALAAGRLDIAKESYNLLREKRGFAFRWDRPDDWILTHYGLAQSSKDGALSYYLQFNQLWSEADPDISSLVHARKMISELSR